MKQLNEFEKQMLIYRIDNLKKLSNKDFMVSFAGIVNDFDLLQKEDIENLQDHDWCRDNIRHEYTIMKPLSKNVSNALVEEKKDNTGRQRYYDNVFYIRGKNVLLSSEWYDGTGRKPDNKTIFINWLRALVNGNPKGIVQASNSVSNYPCQQIFYGAPGTGKSRYVDDVCKKNIHYRITFHPDTDYAAFVGCYKPKSNKKNMLTGNNLNETQLLSCFFNSNDKNKYPNATKARYLYEALTHTKDIRDLGLDANSVAEKLLAKGFKGCAYTTEANCMYNIYDWLQQDGFIVDNKITYEFVPQTFLKAYIEAWKNQASGTPVYLVIEEINRGNCAQIFGDLFQLLDRDKYGYSQYEVDADTDMQEYISSVGLVLSGIKDSDGNDISAEVASGKLLKLPDNLYVWATMNTSDQSLFPIDSAFKRRWEWKYIKIKEGKDENGNKLDWKVDVKMDETGSLLSWWAFIQKINEIIASMTSSADKQLGYFFCCAKDGIIDEETFVSKVIFYLWNDVFKDYGFEDASLFRYTSKDNEGKEMVKDLTFPDFYDEDGEKVNTERLSDFVQKVMNWKKTSEENN